MQAKQMAASLKLIAVLADPRSAEAITRLAEALETAGSKPFGGLAVKLEKGLEAKGHSSTPTQAVEVVARIAEVSSAAGSKPLSKEFAAASRILAALSNTEASAISAVVAEALAPPPKRSAASKKTGIAVNTRELADDLTSASDDNAKFDALVAELNKLPKEALLDVAQRFLATDRVFKTKQEMIKAIKSRQLQDALSASRERRISKIAV
jgi:hypothetical protein